MIGLKCQPLCKHFIPETGGCNIFKAQEKYIKTGKCDEFEVSKNSPQGYGSMNKNNHCKQEIKEDNNV